MSDTVTEEPSTWPAWLRQSRERAHEALRAARKRRRELERTVSRNAVPAHAYPRED